MVDRYAAVHPDAPGGPGDARPTAQAIVNDENLVDKLGDKVFLITGCSPGGLGVEIARAIFSTGAHVFITVRDPKKGEEAANDIRAHHEGKGGKIEVLVLELDSLEAIRKAAAEFLSRSKQLNVLINNAAVMATPEGTTKDGFETQFGTNFVGHFLLFHLLKHALLASSTPAFPSRVVSVSSAGHRFSPILFDDLNLKKRGYDIWAAYGQSKTGNIYLALEIERRYGSKGLHATSVHPGIISTPLGRHIEPEKMTALLDQVRSFMKTPQQGAATIVWAAVAQVWANQGGKYLENCGVAQPIAENAAHLRKGYWPHAYDHEAAKKLWEQALQWVNVADE